MHIVYPLLWSRLGRGADREQAVATAAALGRSGARVTLMLPQGLHDPALDGGSLKEWFGVDGDFEVVQRKSRWAGVDVARSALWLRQVARDPLVRHADLLYSRAPYMFFGGRISPVPFAVEHYRPWPDELPWLRPLIRRTTRAPHCRGFILHSDHTAQSFRRIGVDPAQILVAHNGTDPEHFRNLPSAAEARAALGLPPGRPIALYAGRLNAEKALDQVFALAALRPEILFLLVGSEGRGPVEAEAARHGNVEVRPWQSAAALPAWLRAADLLLVPASLRPLERSRRSVLPMKLFSYLAAGRPILAPRAPDTAELLGDGINALLVEPDRPEAAAAALDRLLANPALAARLGAGALETSRSLTWDARAARILAFLSRR